MFILVLLINSGKMEDNFKVHYLAMIKIMAHLYY
jgi:hypothetical protein